MNQFFGLMVMYAMPRPRPSGADGVSKTGSERFSPIHRQILRIWLLLIFVAKKTMEVLQDLLLDLP
jgi:hypothetical protein